MVKILLLVLLAVLVTADFDAHTFEEENAMLGLDPNGMPLDDVDEMDLIESEDNVDEDEGSGGPTNDCKSEYKKCCKSWWKRTFGTCKRARNKCCKAEFQRCRQSSVDLDAFEACNKDFSQCRHG